MDNFGTSERLRRALLLKTGQTTTYITGDDGDLEKGEPHRYYVLSTGQYSGTTNITINSKTDAHSNACVLDEATGLMWSRAASASVGPNSNGTLPWTVNGSGEGIFTYATAANSASLAGYTDWRVPIDNEMFTMRSMDGVNGYPDSTAFPTVTGNYWTSTTRPDVNTFANQVLFGAGYCAPVIKTSAAAACWLVRGPV